MTEAEQIAEFIARQGVKKCPTRFVAETPGVAEALTHTPDGPPPKHLRHHCVGNRYARSRKKFWLPQY